MDASQSSRAVQILRRLARGWAICKRRGELANERLHTADALAASDQSGLDQLDQKAEALDAAYHDHPFLGFVRLVSHETGIEQDALRAAALIEFDGERELVAVLNALDEKGTTATLFRKLCEECPDVVRRLFGEYALTESKSQSVPGHKRRGRKKADNETVQREAELAAAWVQARDTGTYKAVFAKDKKMTVKPLDALLTRVRKRNSRAD